jgi:hypothetical protein
MLLCYNAIDPVAILVEIIKAQMITYSSKNEDGTGDTER